MGSIIMNEDREFIATYPPPTHPGGFIKYGSALSQACKIYPYQLSCLYCQLITGLHPPSWGKKYSEFFERIGALADATATKLGHVTKYTVLLKKVSNDKDMSRVPYLDDF
jgi:hypothetical protein